MFRTSAVDAPTSGITVPRSTDCRRDLFAVVFVVGAAGRERPPRREVEPPDHAHAVDEHDRAAEVAAKGQDTLGDEAEHERERFFKEMRRREF
jgi:hypothetical protein